MVQVLDGLNLKDSLVHFWISTKTQQQVQMLDAQSFLPKGNVYQIQFLQYIQ